MTDSLAGKPAPERGQQVIEGWVLHEFDSLPSTNPVAGALPAWHAVRADVQTGGRGRTGRVWVSDAGGLWISAVLPMPGERQRWSILPLAAGWAVIQSLHALGVQGLRLRWPNDVLLGKRKLAGLLVEQYRPALAVVGIGVNVFNRPDALDPNLTGHTVALADLTRVSGGVTEVASLVLAALRRAQEAVAEDGFPAIAREINRQWDRERRVELTLNHGPSAIRGQFRSIDDEGRLAFVDDSGARQLLEASQVALLKELD